MPWGRLYFQYKWQCFWFLNSKYFCIILQLQSVNYLIYKFCGTIEPIAVYPSQSAWWRWIFSFWLKRLIFFLFLFHWCEMHLLREKQNQAERNGAADLLSVICNSWCMLAWFKFICQSFQTNGNLTECL